MDKLLAFVDCARGPDNRAVAVDYLPPLVREDCDL